MILTVQLAEDEVTQSEIIASTFNQMARRYKQRISIFSLLSSILYSQYGYLLSPNFHLADCKLTPERRLTLYPDMLLIILVNDIGAYIGSGACSHVYDYLADCDVVALKIVTLPLPFPSSKTKKQSR